MRVQGNTESMNPLENKKLNTWTGELQNARTNVQCVIEHDNMSVTTIVGNDDKYMIPANRVQDNNSG